jgi:hypothetical protein
VVQCAFEQHMVRYGSYVKHGSVRECQKVFCFDFRGSHFPA